MSPALAAKADDKLSFGCEKQSTATRAKIMNLFELIYINYDRYFFRFKGVFTVELRDH